MPAANKYSLLHLFSLQIGSRQRVKVEEEFVDLSLFRSLKYLEVSIYTSSLSLSLSLAHLHELHR